MKKTKLNWIYRNILAIVVGLFVSNNAFAQIINETIENITDIGENVVINVKNLNYDLNYKTWNQKKLKVEYTIHIEAKTDADLNDFYKKLKKEIEQQLKNVSSGSVDISYPFRKVVRNGGNMKVKFEDGSKTHQLKEFKASIVIYAPKKNELNLNGSFSTINIDDLEANASIKINSGKFSIGDCKKLKLQSSFCKNIKVGNVETAELKLSSAGISVGKIKTSLDLNASFSNIEVSKIGGAANIKLSSSTFKSTDLKELSLEGSFVRRFVVNNIEKATINKFSSSEFRAQNIKAFSIENTSFSTFRAAHVKNLNIEKSSSSKFYINIADILEAPQNSFTDFSIGQLNNRFLAKSSSGSIELENVSSGFEKIGIDGEFVNIDIEVEQGAGYKIEADLEFPNFRYNDLNFNKKEKDINSQFLKGWKGNNKNATSEIKLDCKSCSISLD